MDKHFRGKGLWIGIAALGIVFLCLLVFGAMAMMFTVRSGPVYVQPPTGAEGAVPPTQYYGHGPLGMGGHRGVGLFGIIGAGIGLIFKLLFFGLLLLLGLGLVKRFFWGRHHWAYRHWGPPCPPGTTPKGKAGEDDPHAGWGPPPWHRHGKHWGPPASSAWWGADAEQAGKEDEPAAEDNEGAEYAGPQE